MTCCLEYTKVISRCWIRIHYEYSCCPEDTVVNFEGWIGWGPITITNMPGDSPPMQMLVSAPSSGKVLPEGVRRTKFGTYVTNSESRTAFYGQQAIEHDKWDLDSDNNIRSGFPDHDSFESPPDEDEYFIVSTSCNSNFTFTLHPDDCF